MDPLWTSLDGLLGLDLQPHDLSLWQILARATLVYLAGYLLIRLGEHRFLGKNTAFDIVLGFIFGATLSRAINGNAPFLETIAAGILLLSLHWLFVTLTFKSARLDRLLNGEPIPVIQEGRISAPHMHQARINHRLLIENLRLNGRLDDPAQVRSARLEPNGTISVVPQKSAPQVLEVQVEAGVQTIRIRLE